MGPWYAAAGNRTRNTTRLHNETDALTTTPLRLTYSCVWSVLTEGVETDGGAGVDGAVLCDYG